MSENELYHHGIKGQRWGVRRFQSPDGTLTDAGKKRYKAYKKDWKDYDKLNRHVSASQKHLKEEGVMLDRVRDKYLKENRSYEKTLRKSSGLFGLKGAEKADAVAKAQVSMERISKDYESAAGSYGVAKKILNQDTNELKKHVDNMVHKYGKGSINELQYEKVKMGQNKLQKLMQGAPTSIIFEKGRETETFVKTGKTLADMPVVGNMYTSKYIANRELDLMRSRVDSAAGNAKRDTGKDGKDPKWLARDYFKDVSSETESARSGRIKEAKDEADKAKNRVDEAANKLNSAKKESEIAKTELNAVNKGNSPTAKAAASGTFKRAKSKAKSANKEYKNAVKKYNEQQASIKSLEKKYKKTAKRLAKVESKNGTTAVKNARKAAAINIVGAAAGAVAGPVAGYAAKNAIKSYQKKKRKEAWNNFWGVKHSAMYSVVRSDELYHDTKDRGWRIVYAKVD